MTDHDIETRIVRQLLQMALARGYCISLMQDEGYSIKRSTDFAALVCAVQACDVETLALRNVDTKDWIGTVTLVYGNGVDVVSDYTDCEELENLVDDTLRHWS